MAALGRAKRRPGKYRQAQVDGGGVERVDRRIQVQRKGLGGVQRASHTNLVLCKVGVDLPRARGICVGQRVARNRLATKPHVVQPAGLRTQVDFDVAQGFPVSQLREGHGKELVQTREVFDLVFAAMIGHAAAKRAQWQIEHKLREHELALVHGGFGRKSAKNPKSDFRRSNRDQTQALNYSSKSLPYDVLPCERWDTTDWRYIPSRPRCVYPVSCTHLPAGNTSPQKGKYENKYHGGKYSFNAPAVENQQAEPCRTLRLQNQSGYQIT